MTFPDVQGHCPACGATSLYLGDGGYITCSRVDCPEPDAASTLLERDPRQTARAVVESIPRAELHSAIRILARTDPAWWRDQINRMAARESRSFLR